MAMNDISFLATTEQDALLAFKDSNLAKSDKDSGAEFLSQLHNAHNSIEPEKKAMPKLRLTLKTLLPFLNTNSHKKVKLKMKSKT